MTERDKKTSDTRYHAVSIILASEVCDAARALIGKRFLAAEAPAFPVDGCDAASCSCKYRHYGDRRSGPRRARELGMPDQPRPGDERRVSPDRRDEDQRSGGELEGEAANYSTYIGTRE